MCRNDRAVPIPEGFVLAPKDPTPEMIDAARRLALEGDRAPTYVEAYRAMIGAIAPSEAAETEAGNDEHH